MFTILKKEINSFFSSLIAYIVISVFLLVTGLFLWVFPDYAILDFGYANLDPLFFLAPWIFLFLVPAVTMRMFAEEKRNGTIEMLFTKPVSDLQIIGAKFLAGVILVTLALLPTVIYAVSIYLLAEPVGNIDTGSILGSYIGLIFLASTFVSIGIFSSSLSDNQIVAFLIAVFVCFIVYAGFDSLSIISSNNKLSLFIKNLGISEHYQSISKGVVDSRDLVYFFSVITLFILLTNFVLGSRKW